MQDGQQPNEPGFVFRPGDQSDKTPPQAETVQPSSAPQPQVEERPNTAPLPAPSFEDTGSQVSWTASEYVAHPKSAGWFGVLALGSLVLAVLVYLLTRGDIISTAVIVVLGVILGIFAARQPRVLNYSINNKGLLIGEKYYPYGSFKSFSIMHESNLGYISLLPLRRFMPPLSIHYDPADEDKIVDTLVKYLPYEEHKPDMVDNLTRRFRL